MARRPRPLRIVIGGATGRMGRQVAALAVADPRFALVGGVGLEAEFDAGFPYGRVTKLPGLLEQADALVDFSLPAGTMAFAKAAAKALVPAVIGTTGLKPAQMAKLRSYSKRIPVFYAPNMSPGMNLLFALARRASAALEKYDAAISETHHTRKKDAPSGSALRLAEAVQAGRGARSPVPTVSIRAGDVIGDHSLLLAGPDERLELKHQAQSRTVFARGGLEAALWVARRRPGLYTMKEMLGL